MWITDGWNSLFSFTNINRLSLLFLLTIYWRYDVLGVGANLLEQATKNIFIMTSVNTLRNYIKEDSCLPQFPLETDGILGSLVITRIKI